jgi:hypothetical protein
VRVHSGVALRIGAQIAIRLLLADQPPQAARDGVFVAARQVRLAGAQEG